MRAVLHTQRSMFKVTRLKVQFQDAIKVVFIHIF